MAWYRQPTSHYINQSWARSVTLYGIIRPQWVNWLRPEQNVWHFENNICRCIFLKENFCILFKISLKFVPKGQMVQVMAWSHQASVIRHRDSNTSHYLNQCWPTTTPSYDIPRPQWVNQHYPLPLCHIVQLHWHLPFPRTSIKHCQIVSFVGIDHVNFIDFFDNSILRGCWATNLAAQGRIPGIYTTKTWWADKWNLAKIPFAIIRIPMIHSGHNFAHDTTAQLSWHVQNCDLIWSLLFM